MLSSKPAADAAALSGDFLHVVAGAIVDSADRILIAQRPAGRHLAGGWEFPGGKLDPGEGRQRGLAREMSEELGIEVLRSRPLIRLKHHYADRAVLLDLWFVEEYIGEPRGLDGQQIRWCTREDLLSADLLAADRPAVTALRLPSVIDSPAGTNYELIRFEENDSRLFDVSANPPARMLGVVCGSAAQANAAAQARVSFIVLNVTLSVQELAQLCDQVNLPVYAAGVDLEIAWNSGAAGVSKLAR